MLGWLKRTQIIQKVLVSYWLLVPVLFYGVLGLYSLQEATTIQQVVQSNPLVTVGNLVACIMLLQAGLFYLISKNSASKRGLLGHFLLIALVQQVLTLNILGVVLTFLYYRTLPNLKEQTNNQLKILFYMLGGFITILSVVVTLVLVNFHSA